MGLSVLKIIDRGDVVPCESGLVDDAADVMGVLCLCRSSSVCLDHFLYSNTRMTDAITTYIQ